MAENFTYPWVPITCPVCHFIKWQPSKQPADCPRCSNLNGAERFVLKRILGMKRPDIEFDWDCDGTVTINIHTLFKLISRWDENIPAAPQTTSTQQFHAVLQSLEQIIQQAKNSLPKTNESGYSCAEYYDLTDHLKPSTDPPPDPPPMEILR